MSLVLALCALGAAGLLMVGGLGLIAPARLAQSYGVPATHPIAIPFVRAAAARDVVLGLITGANVYLRDLHILAVIFACGVLLALADFLIVYITMREWRSQLISHIGGAAGFAALLALVLRALQQ